MHLVFCLGGLPPLPLDLGRARGVAVPLGCRLGRAGALPLLLLLRERAKWELPARCRLPFHAPPTSLSLPSPHRTFHDVRIRGRLRSLATACYPPVVLDLRVMEHGRRGGPGHVGVARGLRCGCRFCSSSRSRLRGRERRLRSSSAWLSSRARSCRVRSQSSDRCRSRRGSSRSRCDRSRSLDRYRAHRDRLWRDRWWSVDRSRSRHQRTRFPCLLGDRTLSRIARVTTRGQAGDYLALLPACGRRGQDGWPDEKPRRVLGAVASQPPVASEAAAAIPPIAGGTVFTALPSALQGLARCF